MNASNVTEMARPVYENCELIQPLIKDYAHVYTENDSSVTLSTEAQPLIVECLLIFDSVANMGWYANRVLVLVVVAGLALNFFVISVLVLDKNKTSSDYYLVSIAVGDTAICVGSFISSQLEQGPVVYSIGNIIGNLGMFACLSTVMAFTIERYCAVKDPMSSLYTCSRERSARIVLTTWIGLVIHCILVELLSLEYPITDSYSKNELRLYALFYVNFTLFYILPVGVSLTLYSLILSIIHQRERDLDQLMGPLNGDGHAQASASRGHINAREDRLKKTSVASTKLDSDFTKIPSSNPTVRHAPIPSRNSGDERVRRLLCLKKMMKMFLLVLVSFVVLMSPYRWVMFTWGVYSRVNGVARLQAWSHFYHKLCVAIFSILYASNSIVDPILYNILAKRFRTKVWNITTKFRSNIRRSRRFQRATQGLPMTSDLNPDLNNEVAL